MADGPLKGIFRCRRCGFERVEPSVGFNALERLRRTSKERVLSEIRKRKAIKMKTLQYHFPDLPVMQILRELVQEGRVTIQQSGFAGHSVAHGKLAVLGKDPRPLS